MTVLLTDHCCSVDEPQSGAFVLYSLLVTSVAVGIAGDVNFGMVVFVLPAFEATVVNLKTAQSLKPVDSSAALTVVT